jgi:PAS domain S-box-containing protein
VVFDADNRLMFGNRVYAEMVRVPANLLQSGTHAEAIYRFLIGRNPENLAGRSVEATVTAQISALRAGGEDTEFSVGDSTYLRRNRVLPNGLVIGLRSDISAFKRTQSQLRERTELLELALDATSDGLWDWNIEANQNYLSPRWKALLGYSDHEIGNSLSVWQAHIHPLDRDVVARAVEAHLDQRAPFNIEYRMQHRSGEFRWFQVRGRAVLDVQGRPRRMAGFATDIHDRKMQALELEKTRALLHDAIEALDAGLVRYDQDARLVFCNRRFAELLGYTPELVMPGAHERDLIAEFQQRNASHLDPEERGLIVEEALARTRVADKPFELQSSGQDWHLGDARWGAGSPDYRYHPAQEHPGRADPYDATRRSRQRREVAVPRQHEP